MLTNSLSVCSNKQSARIHNQPMGSNIHKHDLKRTFTWSAGTGTLAAKLAAKVALLAANDVISG